MDDRTAADRPSTPAPGAPAVIVVAPDGHDVAQAVAERLARAGWIVVPCPDIYRAVIEIACRIPPCAAAVVAVDFFNRDELRFFPMAARRWPEMRTVGVSRPAFAYKASMADLAGATAMCTEADRAEDVLRALDLSAGGNGHRARRQRVIELDLTAHQPAADVPPERVETPRRDAAPSEAVQSLLTPMPGAAGGNHHEPPPGAEQNAEPSGNGRARHDADPRRSAPQPPAPERRPPGPQASADPNDLLTQDELSALMADFDDDGDETD